MKENHIDVWSKHQLVADVLALTNLIFSSKEVNKISNLGITRFGDLQWIDVNNIHNSNLSLVSKKKFLSFFNAYLSSFEENANLSEILLTIPRKIPVVKMHKMDHHAPKLHQQ